MKRSTMNGIKRHSWRGRVPVQCSVLVLCAAALLPASVLAAEYPDDALNSPLWEVMATRFLGPDARIVFDDRVKMLAPDYAGNAMDVPVQVSAPKLSGVEKIVVFADLNPIPKILEYYPVQAKPVIAFHFKIEQPTPVHVAMRTADGVWHVGGRWISSQGGGCTTVSSGAGNRSVMKSLGEITGGIWPRSSERQRLRFRVMHPMDTGLVANIPAFYVTDITMRSADGDVLARLETTQAVSKNPIFAVTLDHQGPVQISARDDNGNQFHATEVDS